MLWLFLMLTTLTAEQSVNLMFAALCLGMAAGLNTRLAQGGFPLAPAHMPR
jgi:hypothetical protein